MRRVSPKEAHALMTGDGYAYLDVRSVPEFELGHPSGAYNVPWLEPGEHGMVRNPDFVQEVARVLAPSRAIIVGCATGVRSLEAAGVLQEHGFVQLVEQRAGMSGVRDPFGRVQEGGWQDQALPVSTLAEPGRSHREIRAATLG